MKFNLRKLILASIAAIIVVAFILTYFFFDPTAYDFFPECTFLMLTDLKCPGCGSQRAIHALLNGNFIEAVKFNAIFVVSLVFIAIYIYAEFTKNKHPELFKLLNSRGVIYSIIGIFVAWWILRNIFGW